MISRESSGFAKFAITLVGLTTALLATQLSPCATAAPPQWPSDCPRQDAKPNKMPGALPVDEGYVDFVNADSGQRTVLYYSNQSGLAAELLRPSLPDSAAASPAAYRLYDHRHGKFKDVSSIPNWPNGPCNATAGDWASLGPALTELRDSVLVNGASPCLVALVAPDLAAAHGHHADNATLAGGWNLTWSSNGTTCFYDNQTAETVWVVRVEVFNGSGPSEVSGITLELQLPPANASAVPAEPWRLAQRRAYRFLSGQRRPPSQDAVSSMANTPAFAVCGAAREHASVPPVPPKQLAGSLRLVAAPCDTPDTVVVVDDLAANAAISRTLTPPPGSKLRDVYGPGRLLLVEDRSGSSTAAVFAIGQAAGNCSLVGASSSPLPPVGQAGPLPFDLSDSGWLFTGEAVQFNGQACQRYLLTLAAVQYEVYFASGKFSALAGYRIRSGNASDSTVVVEQVGPLDADPVDYDLTACVAPAVGPGGNATRLVMRLNVPFDQLLKVNRVKLVSETRSAVAKAAACSPLRIAQISVARDADAQQSQVWLTLLGLPNQPPSLADSLKSLNAAVASTGGISLFGGRVAKLEEAAAATGGGGGGSVVVVQGHSGGAMAGLAFFMLLVGSVLGVVGAWCVWKRRPNMPYYVQD